MSTNRTFTSLSPSACGTVSYGLSKTPERTKEYAVASSYTSEKETVTLGTGVTAVGSTNADGTGAEAYNAQNKDTYKYFKAEAAKQ